MSQCMLQINFTYSISREELDALAAGRAEPIAEMPGLQWKIWVVNEKESECGGHYLFTDESSADNYINSPLVEALISNPAVSNASVKKFSIMDAPTSVTRGPV
jgi:Putative mono-oxygenase ydhR